MCSGETDYEEVLRVLPEEFLSSWKDEPDVVVQLCELGSLGLQQLAQEPSRLEEERLQVLEQTQELAFGEYKTFIRAAECSRDIFTDFSGLEQRLDQLLKELPAVSSRCGELGREAGQVSSRWRQASHTLARHPQLQQLLDIPDLMLACIREGLCDEALELASLARRLERKQGGSGGVALVAGLVEEVLDASHLMLQGLLDQLATNIALPQCLKVVGHLRRAGAFSERELRLKFLQARDAWFAKVVAHAAHSTPDPYDRISKVVEVSRVHLFDITTQYRAVFSDDDALLGADTTPAPIFHSWLADKVSWFCATLEGALVGGGVSGGRADTLLTQVTYFGLSFGRASLDFRPLLAPLFHTAALAKFARALRLAGFAFEEALKAHSFAAHFDSLGPPSSHHPSSEDSLEPPAVLLDFPPLAHYCNHLLAALNDLRLCCSLALAQEVRAALSQALSYVVKVLVSFHAKHNHALTGPENDRFNRLCSHFCSDLLPHLNKCLAVVFCPEDISRVLGITSMEFKKIEHLCKVDVEEITRPLSAILPVKEEDVGLVLAMRSEEVVEPTDLPTESVVEDTVNATKSWDTEVLPTTEASASDPAPNTSESYDAEVLPTTEASSGDPADDAEVLLTTGEASAGYPAANISESYGAEILLPPGASAGDPRVNVSKSCDSEVLLTTMSSAVHESNSCDTEILKTLASAVEPSGNATTSHDTEVVPMAE